jgi:hypothetical protein
VLLDVDGMGGMREVGGGGNRDVQETQISCGFSIEPLTFALFCKRKIWDFVLKDRDLNPIG